MLMGTDTPSLPVQAAGKERRPLREQSDGNCAHAGRRILPRRDARQADRHFQADELGRSGRAGSDARAAARRGRTLLPRAMVVRCRPPGRPAVPRLAFEKPTAIVRGAGNGARLAASVPRHCCGTETDRKRIRDPRPLETFGNRSDVQRGGCDSEHPCGDPRRCTRRGNYRRRWRQHRWQRRNRAASMRSGHQRPSRSRAPDEYGRRARLRRCAGVRSCRHARAGDLRSRYRSRAC